jgi:hypothetical protein
VSWLKRLRSWAQTDLRYVDVSKREDVADEVSVSRSLLSPLRERGFNIAGFLEQRSGQQRYVTVALVDPDRICFARPEDLFGRPHVSFKTLLEDGTIVDTRNTVRYALLDVLAIFSPYHHQPSAGYLTERLGRAPPETIWERHRERLREIVEARRTRVRPHDMAVCTHAMNRSWAVASRRTNLGIVVAMLVGLALVMLSELPSFSTLRWLLLWTALPLSLAIGGAVAAKLPFRPRPLDETLGPRTDLGPAGQTVH